jgi:hypothetical protein
VQQRHVYRRLDLPRYFVHGVRAEDDGLGPGAADSPGRVREDLAGCLPAALVLQQLDVMEVDAVEGKPR